ncbi:MFS transporter [Nocardioides sp. W3-2-3]|uniref:MFS transporter n=1 Tax=Nocardioides convexus TaxID=2712224 RepID=UPI002418B4D8|nr:MFS transporter [Nocardioides convexus]NHA00354.1 MFS transporter [Nocardioides convexus]
MLATSTAADEHARHRALGWWAAAGGIGMAAGPLLGGLLVSALDWRAVFGVNVVVGLPAVVVALRVVPDLARRPRRADVQGMAAATLLIGGLVFGLIEAPAQGWSAPGVLVALGLAVAGLAAFVHTARTSAAPLLPAAVYADRGFGSSAVQGVLLNFTFYGLLFGLSLTLQQGRGLDAVTTGLLFLPLTGLISLGNLRAAAASRRFGRGAVVAAGQAGLAVSLVAVALTSRAEAEWPLVLALLPVGLTAGLVVPTLTAQSLAAVPVALHGAASAVFNSSRQVGAAVGVAVFGPLLGTGRALHDGFERCVLIGAGAILVSLLVGLAVGSGGRLRGGGYARES